MRHWSIVLFVLMPAAVAAGPLTPRPLDDVAAGALATAVARSALVREIVGELERSDVIVHVESSRQLPAGIGGATRFVASCGGYRYVRITLSLDLRGSSRIAMLGHELQHAAEIARSHAADHAGLERLFETRGYRPRGGHTFFETQAAIYAERRIRLELREHRPPASSAVPGR